MRYSCSGEGGGGGTAAQSWYVQFMFWGVTRGQREMQPSAPIARPYQPLRQWLNHSLPVIRGLTFSSVIVEYRTSSRYPAPICEYKQLRNIYHTSNFREKGPNLSIRKHKEAYGSIRKHTAGLRWYLAQGASLWVYCEAWRSRTWYSGELIRLADSRAKLPPRETGPNLSIRKHTASIRRAYAGTLPMG